MGNICGGGSTGAEPSIKLRPDKVFNKSFYLRPFT